MDKLSERLGIHAQDVAQAAEPNDDMVLGYHQLRDLAEALTEAAALAKRCEDAPTGFVVGQAGNVPTLEAAIVHMDDPSKIKGQRVRLVVEGGER